MLKHILSYFKKYIFMIVLLYAIILMHGAEELRKEMETCKSN